MIKERGGRHDAIRQIVRAGDVRTQKDVVDKLQERGYSCTQATVSRDIADMGLHKVAEGTYVLPEDLHLERMCREFVVNVEEALNQIVIKTRPGTATSVASALDAVKIEQVIGSVAGTNTVLAIARDDEAALSTGQMLRRLANSSVEDT